MKKLITLNLFALIVISANAQCTANYSYSGTSVDTVVFTNLSTASNAHYYWNFGDGSSSNDVNPVHVYPDDGHYLVTLYVHDTVSGCSDAKDTWIDVIKPDTLSCNIYFTDTIIGDGMYTTDLSVNCNNYYMNCRVAANGFGSCNHGSVSGWARSLFLHSLDAETHDSINGYEFVKSFRRTLPNRYSSAINYQNCSANFEINIDYQLSGALVSFSAMNKNATSYQWQIVGFGNPIYTTNDTSSHFYPYTNYADWQAWLIGLVIHDNVNACSDTVTQEFIIVNPNWVSPANCTLYQQPQSQTVYAGSDVQFIIHTNSGVSKQWQQDAGLGWDTLTNAGPFTGVNTDTLTVHNVQIWWNNYHYRCLISNDSNNCHNMTSEAILTVQVVGIDEIANQNSFSISPNPFHTTGTLHLNPSFSQAELKIYNVLGGEVKRQKITSQTTVISRDGMADGIYFISVNDGEKEWRGRVVVE